MRAFAAARLASIAVLSVLTACVASCAADTSDPEPISPRSSAFLRARYGQPMSADDATLLTIAEVLRLTGHERDGRLLRQAVERRTLKKLLREPFEPGPDVEAAIKAESTQKEGIESLQERVFRSLEVSKTPSRGDELSALERRPSYLGNSLWVAPPRDATHVVAIHVRVTAKNHTAGTVESFDLLYPSAAGRARGPFVLQCVPEARGASLPPGGQAAFTCARYEKEVFAKPAIEALRKDPLRLPTRVTGLKTLGEGGGIGAAVDRGQEAEAQISRAGCEALANCEQVAKIEKARQERIASTARSLNYEQRKHAYVVITLLALGALVLAVLRMTPRPTSSSGAWIPLLVGPLVFASLVELVTLLLILFGLETVLLYFLMPAIFFATLPQILVVVILISVLAHATERISRFRVFAAGMGALSLALFWGAMFWVLP